MRLNPGDTVLIYVYFAPNLTGVEVAEIESIEMFNNKPYYNLRGKKDLYRQDQIILKFTSDQVQRYEIIKDGPNPVRGVPKDITT